MGHLGQVGSLGGLGLVDLINLRAAREDFQGYPELVGITCSTVFQLIFWCPVQEPLEANLVPNMAQLGTQNASKMEPQTPLQSNFFHLGGKPENEQQYSGFACFFMSGETPGRPNFLKNRCLKAKGFPSVF